MKQQTKQTKSMNVYHCATNVESRSADLNPTNGGNNMRKNVEDVLLAIPFWEYQTDELCGKILGNNLLGDFRKSPKAYFRKISGEAEVKTTKQLAFERAMRKFLLEGEEAFNKEYLVDAGPINPKTGLPYTSSAKVRLEWEAEQDRPICDPEDKAYFELLKDVINESEDISRAFRYGLAEGIIRSEVEGLPCQTCFDWFNPEHGIFTFMTSLNLDRLWHDSRATEVVYQLAFCRMVLREATGMTVSASLIGCEKSEPYRVGLWRIAPSVLDEAERINRKLMQKLKTCIKVGIWETGFEKARTLETFTFPMIEE